MYKTFPLSLILKLDAIFTLARHVQLKIMPIPLFKTKRYQILVSKPLKPGDGISETLNSKIFWGSMPPDPPSCKRLRRLATISSQ